MRLHGGTIIQITEQQQKSLYYVPGMHFWQRK